MATSDDVQLTDLEVIQRFSLAVRGATAPREQVIAALQSDLAYLQGARKQAPAPKAPAAKAPAAKAPAAKAPARKAPAKKAPAKKTARRA